MKVLVDKKDIEKQHQAFIKKLDKFKSERIIARTGHKGHSFDAEVCYSKELNIWWYFKGTDPGKSGVRYWNAFGTGKPKPGKLVHIICEINYPESGINKKVAASWVKDGGDVLLVHSGNIGGGRKGIGKNGFIENYNGSFQELDVDGLPNLVTVLGSIKDPRLPHSIANFVREVARVKAVLVGKASGSKPQDPLEKIQHTFNEEFSGTKSYDKEKGKVAVTAYHGLVVNSLKEIISDKGHLVANDQQRDLYIYTKKSEIDTVFEVKTSVTSQTIFTAIGQLFVNNARLKTMPKLVFVIPEKPTTNLAKTLAKLNVKVLVYNWIDNRPTFNNLESVLAC